MKIEKNARTTGTANVVIATIAASILVALQFFVFSKQDIPTVVIVLTWLVVGLVAGAFLNQGIRLLRAGGKWRVSVSDGRIEWVSPNEAVDRSFSLALSEIDRVETRIRRKRGRQTANRDYVLVLTSAEDVKLSPNSGIDLRRVVKALEEQGVRHQRV